jgi:hypothetical protein
MPYRYAREKLYDVVEIMTTDEGDVRKRLANAYSELDMVSENHLPEEFHSKVGVKSLFLKLLAGLWDDVALLL